MMTLEEALRRLQHDTLTEYDRAALEAMVWNMASREDRAAASRRGKGGIGVYVNERVPSASQYAVAQRHRLHRSGIIELWDEVRRGMPLATAVRILQDSEKAWQTQGGDFRTVVLQSLETYNGDGTYVTQLAGGQNVRRRARPAEPTPFGHGRSHADLWKTVRDALHDYLDRQLGAVDDAAADEARRAAVVEVDLALAAVARIASRANSSGGKGPDRRAVVAACQQLNVEPPKIGSPADLSRAKRAMRRVVSQAHPDLRQGDTSMQDAMNAALAAVATLEEYNEWIAVRASGGPKEQTT